MKIYCALGKVVKSVIMEEVPLRCMVFNLRISNRYVKRLTFLHLNEKRRGKINILNRDTNKLAKYIIQNGGWCTYFGDNLHLRFVQHILCE